MTVAVVGKCDIVLKYLLVVTHEVDAYENLETYVEKYS